MAKKVRYELLQIIVRGKVQAGYDSVKLDGVELLERIRSLAKVYDKVEVSDYYMGGFEFRCGDFDGVVSVVTEVWGPV